MATALLVAAFTDIKRREIDNWLNAAIALAAPIWWLVTGYTWIDAALQLGLAVATFIVTALLFAMRQMGGGDVKLLTALALWFSAPSFLQVIVMMALIGGGASVAMAFFNMKRVHGEVLRDVLAGVAAALWVSFACAAVYSVMTRRPPVGPGMLATIGAAMPPPWVIALTITAALAILAFGLSHMLRRQKSRLPIPYGVAISLAGLWVLTQQALAAVS
ncbi:MAG TPA: prepilin peptidase [Novosphingobium sp.]|nr:prepilin peptidase [Novosphingobium sp.]